MVQAQIYLAMETYTQGSTCMGSQMGKANINGAMVVYTLESSRTASSMEKASGERDITQTAINMKASTIWTRSMAMEYFNGKVAIYIKATTRTMIEMAMVK